MQNKTISNNIFNVMPTTDEIDRARKILKVKDSHNIEKVLQFFEVGHWVAVENKKIEEIPKLVHAKNILLRHLVSEQMLKQRFFKIESPFDNSCCSCRGTGEIYKFETETIEVKCRSCGGEGKKWITCPSCKGSGRYKVKWREGGGIDEPCKRCESSIGTEHEFQIYVNCFHCNSADQEKIGKKMINVKSHIIKSTTACRFCGQLGFTKNIPYQHTKAFKAEQKAKEPRTPGIRTSIGDQLKKQLIIKAESSKIETQQSTQQQ